jgi:nucleoside-diphosphate-sugar epimerase
MHVALIGATGRVGSRLVTELLSRGHTVTGVARMKGEWCGPGFLGKATGKNTFSRTRMPRYL